MNLCDGSSTIQQSQLASTHEGLKTSTACKQRAGEKISLEMVLPKLRMGFLHPPYVPGRNVY